MHRISILLTGLVIIGVTAAGFAQGDGRQGRAGRPGGAGAPGRGPQGPPITTLAGDVQSDLDRTRELFINMVNAMPAEKFDYKPTAAQQTFGERVMHIVQADQFILRSLGGKAQPPAINQQAASKADILTALRQLYDWEAALMKEFTDQQLTERIMPPAFLGPSASRVRVFYYSLQHTEDIYGQLVVYLRLNGVTPPASQRGGV